MDGGEALTKLRQKEFGLVVSDWNMNPMTGLQLLQEVRQDEKLKALPFIMVTAESKTDNVVAAKEAGVSNYIVKPFNAATLKSKLPDAVKQDLVRNRAGLPSWAAPVVRSLADTHVTA